MHAERQEAGFYGTRKIQLRRTPKLTLNYGFRWDMGLPGGTVNKGRVTEGSLI